MDCAKQLEFQLGCFLFLWPASRRLRRRTDPLKLYGNLPDIPDFKPSAAVTADQHLDVFGGIFAACLKLIASERGAADDDFHQPVSAEVFAEMLEFGYRTVFFDSNRASIRLFPRPTDDGLPRHALSA